MPLQHTYRPNDFETFIGNEEVIASLKAVLERKKDTPHCFMFTGPSGIGKTTLARIIKSKLNVSDSDYIELDASSDRGIDAMRELKERSKYYPMNGANSLILLDECHGITNLGIESLLKLLEEPPTHTYFILCTTESNAFKATLKRRLHCYDLKSVNERVLQHYLEYIYGKEGIEVTESDKKVIQKIAENSDGSPGKAMKLLDQVIDLEDYNQIVTLIEDGSPFNETNVAQICQSILKNKPWDELGKEVKALTGDFEEYRRNIMAYFSAVLVNTGDKRVADIMMNFTEPITVHSGKAALILLVYLASKS